MIYEKNTTAPIFKGATRPATIWGIPTKAAAFVTLIILILFTVSGQIGFLLLIPIVLFMMKQIAKTDDQIFHQMGLLCLTSFRSLRSRHCHGGLTFINPVTTERRKNKIVFFRSKF